MEEQITLLLKSHDTKAINLLYDNYSHFLYGAIFRIVNSSNIAEEVMQDTFVKAWQHRDSFDSTKGRLSTWLLNIARNKAIDVTRGASWKKSVKTGDLSSAASLTDYSTHPEHIDLRIWVDKLNPKHKVLIDLVYFQGFTQHEIAEQLSMPIGTIKTRLRQALMDLRTVFNDITKYQKYAHEIA